MLRLASAIWQRYWRKCNLGGNHIDAEVDLNQDAEADVGAEEVEGDLKPTHRTKALDALAGIETEFALVRRPSISRKWRDCPWKRRLFFRVSSFLLRTRSLL